MKKMHDEHKHKKMAIKHKEAHHESKKMAKRNEHMGMEMYERGPVKKHKRK